MTDVYAGSASAERGPLGPLTQAQVLAAVEQAREALAAKLRDHGRDPRRFGIDRITVTVESSG